ncbi:MAG: C1 family peptidase [Clostridiales bacterium]|nr:C1 family peptidase [Clostridiales bacterium]
MKDVSPITADLLGRLERGYDSDPQLNVFSNALSDTTLTSAAFVPSAAARLRMDFSVEVPTTGITNQKQSGRCWMFSAMNLVRERVVQRCNLEDFAISGAYLAFYDKLEKCNNFFESVLHYADLPLDARENVTLMRRCLTDGGQWDMAVSLMKKYGVVPSWVMPETVHSSGTAEWNDVLCHKLREDALELRRLHEVGQDTAARREEMLQELYNALCILYGRPPKTFDFVYTDKDKQYHCHPNMTPKTFFEAFVGDDLDEYVNIVCGPDHPYHRTYSQPFMGNVVEDDIVYLNVTMDELEALAIAQLKSGEGVPFACDCHPFRERAAGYWDQDSFQYGPVLGGLTFGMTAAERLQTRDSTMNHAMFLCGVNLTEDGAPDRWKIENSWGEANGQKGYYVCSEKWFRAYTMQVIVRKSLLTEAQRAMLPQPPIPTPYWDTLA